MLEGPRADRHGSDNPAFWCRGEAPQLAEGDFTRMSEQAGLRRRPLRQVFRVPSCRPISRPGEMG
jgi:hypothetical protein